MVYKPGLEPEPGLGLWQALNSGLAQDFQSPSPPKPGPSQGFEPEPGPIHHYTEGLEVCFMINSTSDADTEAQIPECNFFLPSLQVDLLHCSPATILVHTMNLLVLYNFIFIPFSPSILFCSYFIPLAHSIPPFPH
jgi:hypothetical protein